MCSLVYFDTNVFDNLVKRTGGVSEADEERLRANVSSGKLTVVAGHINLRETLAALQSRPEIARAQLSLIVNLADWDRFAKFSTQILEDDVRHFAFNGEGANTPFEMETTHIRSAMQGIIDGQMSGKELEAVIGEDREQKRAFRDSVKKSRDETTRELGELKKVGEIPSFEQFFLDGAEGWALVACNS